MNTWYQVLHCMPKLILQLCQHRIVLLLCKIYHYKASTLTTWDFETLTILIHECFMTYMPPSAWCKQHNNYIAKVLNHKVPTVTHLYRYFSTQVSNAPVWENKLSLELVQLFATTICESWRKGCHSIRDVSFQPWNTDVITVLSCKFVTAYISSSSIFIMFNIQLQSLTVLSSTFCWCLLSRLFCLLSFGIYIVFSDLVTGVSPIHFCLVHLPISTLL